MDEKHNDFWALVLSEGKRFLGNITKFLGEYTDGDVTAGVWVTLDNTKSPKDQQLYVLTSGMICLDPVLDFISMDQPQMGANERGEPSLGLKKTPLVLPYDYAMKGAKIYTKWSSIMFIADLHEDDQKTYQELIKDGLSKTGTFGLEKPLITIPPPGTIIPTRPHSRGNGGR
jgi:hypothetical protein